MRNTTTNNATSRRRELRSSLLAYSSACRDVAAGPDAPPWCALHGAMRVPLNPRILGESVKVRHSADVGDATKVAYLAPATESARWNTCANSTPECAEVCLGHSTGHLILDSSRNARLWKTVAFKLFRELAIAVLCDELRAHEAAALRAGFQPAARLDGSSDLFLAKHVAADFPGIRFYEYTKAPARAFRSLQADVGGAAPVHVTLSYTGYNAADCARYLQAGGTVAMVVSTRKGETFPESVTLEGRTFPVVDGDAHDSRFRQPAGTVAALTLKAAADLDGARAKAGAFVMEV